MLKSATFDEDYTTYFERCTILEGGQYSFYRVASIFTSAIQTAAPTPAVGATYHSDAWYFRSPSSGYFRMRLASQGYNSERSIMLRINDGSGEKNLDALYTSLGATQRVELERKRYKLSFMAKRVDPTTDGKNASVVNACTKLTPYLSPSTATATNISSEVQLQNDYEWHAYSTILDLTAGQNTTDWAFALGIQTTYTNDKTDYACVLVDDLVLELTDEEPEEPKESFLNFEFEADKAPQQWKVTNGTLATSTDHFMAGEKSLKWNTNSSTSVIEVDFPTPFATASNALHFHIHSTTPAEGTLLVELLDEAGVVRRKATLSLEFMGWREYKRIYNRDFEQTSSNTIVKARLTLQNSKQEAVQLSFDSFNFANSNNTALTFPEIAYLDIEHLNSSNTDKLLQFSFVSDLPLEEPTEVELSDLNLLKAKFLVTPTQATTVELRAIRTYVDNLNIQRNEDGSVKSTAWLDHDNTADYWLTLLFRLGALAVSSSEADNKRYNDFLDLILDQNVLYRVNTSGSAFSYTTMTEVPKRITALAPYSSQSQQVELAKLARWNLNYGMINDPDYNHKVNSDVIYNTFPFFFTAAINQPTVAESVRELKTVVRYLSRATEPTPGGSGFIKVDGSGFHHKTIYLNYMYSYKTFNSMIADLSGTCYRLAPEGYERFKMAVLSALKMATRNNLNGSDSGNFTGNSLSGRHPLSGGNRVQFTRGDLATLATTGGDILGTDVDPEVAEAYAYFFPGDTTFGEKEAEYDGFHQFNYGQLGIYRQNEWVAVMRTPTSKMWGAEIYDKTNRFGRYQAHGTLEVLYNNKTFEQNGMTKDATGWDWNVFPGSTTVHYTDWREMTPNRNVTDRFDQFTKTTDFAGSLSWGDIGVFGSEFDQVDNWGSQRFKPTNLEFKKSVYAFDGMLVSLGSDISSNVTFTSDMTTATNLFQSTKLIAEYGKFLVDGVEIPEGVEPIINPSENNLWLITPETTGYYLPQGNDPLTIKYGEQRTPNKTGSNIDNPALAVASKAYINHGINPKSANYHFVVVPSATPERMEQLKKEARHDGGDLYKVHACNSQLHAMSIHSRNVTAYTIYEPVSNLDFGYVTAAASEMLLMSRQNGEHAVSFAATNPNLRPGAHVSGWIATPTETSITLEGEWRVAPDAPEGLSAAFNGSETSVSFTLHDGEPIYFDLVTDINLSVDAPVAKKGYKVISDKSASRVTIHFDELLEKGRIDLLSVTGRTLASQLIVEGDDKITFPMNALPTGAYLLRVVTPSMVDTIKTIW